MEAVHPFPETRRRAAEKMIELSALTKKYGAFTAVDSIDLKVGRGELLALFDLEEWRDELVESYSHGMRQKLIISSAFIHRPDVIVVDEPMVGLDPKAAKILKDMFREYVARGHTIVMSTHTLEVAQAMCDRICIVQGGKIRAEGTMDELR